ncbi:MAG: hypothetical protein AB7P37_21235 [Ramlibacter sp.]
MTSTPGERAYNDYFWARHGVNSEGQPLPVWLDLPPNMKAWWEMTAIRPPGARTWWQRLDFWVNAGVLALATAESQIGLLRDVLPGPIFAWVAFGLPLANAGVRAWRAWSLKP